LRVYLGEFVEQEERKKIQTAEAGDPSARWVPQ